ncbi:dynein axonemal heavy chain 14 [Rhinophrynus dorsalis]
MSMSEHRPVQNTDLLSRLHLQPEKSDVLRMVSRQGMMHKQAVTGIGESDGLIFIPRPPSVNMEKSSAVIRTFMYRGDLKRKGTRLLREEKKEVLIKHRKEMMGSVRPEGIMPGSEGGDEKKMLIRPEAANKRREDLSVQPTQTGHIVDDSVITHIFRLRAKLGWKTEFSRKFLETKYSVANKYRNMMEEKTIMKAETGEFVYCLPRCWENPKGRYDPYDLHVVPAAVAVHSGVYWTVSASQICKVHMVTGKEDMDIVPVMDWLHEREYFYAIKNLKVFSEFRLWKAFSVWKMNIHRRKSDNSKTIMLQQLFLADELFQGCLLYFQSVCEEVVNIQPGRTPGDLAIQFVKIDEFRTYTLTEFCDLQSQQCTLALEKIGALRGRILSVITHTFLKVAEREGLEDVFLLESQIKPNYTILSKWRYLLEWFERFLKLADCIFQEMLRRLVSNSIQILVRSLEASYTVTLTDEKKNMKLSESKKQSRAYSANASKQTNPIENIIQQQSKSETDIVKVLSDIRRSIEGKKEVVPPMFEVNVVLSRSNVVPMQDDIPVPESPPHNPGSRTDRGQMTPRITDKAEDLLSRKQVTFKEEHASLNDSGEFGDDDEGTLDSKREFEIHIQGIVDGCEQMISKFVSFSQEPCLSKFCSQTCRVNKDKNQNMDSLDTWTTCELLLGMDPDYQSQVKKINSLVKMSMEELGIYSGQFNKYCKMVERAENVRVKICGAQVDLSPNDYRSILVMFHDFIAECEHMNIETRLHTVRVKSLDFQMDCLQHLESIVEMIYTSLPVIAHEKNIQLLEVIHKALGKLNKELTRVEEFVEHLTILSQISSEVPSLEREYSIIIQLYSITKDYNIPVSPEETALYQSLIPSFQQLKSTVLFCAAKRDENIVKFSGELDTYISNLHFELMDFKAKVRDPLLLQDDTFPLEAKEMIQSLLEEFEVISNKARCYSTYQERFGSSLTQMKAQLVDEMLSKRSVGGAVSTHMVNADLTETEYDLNLRKLLWESKEEWEQLSEGWKLTPFELLNVDVIQRDVNRFSHTLFMLEKGLPVNDIVAFLRQSVMDFKQSLPLVVALSNTCLLPRHLDVIQFTIGRAITKDKDFTLGNLLELKIFHHKDKIIEISTTATNEATLEGMLNKVIHLWNKTEFKLTSHRSELSEIWIIASAEEIVAQIEECQVIISTIKGSRYAGPIKNTVDEWERKLNLFLRTMEEWMICQRNWLYLEQIFLASDIQRQLPAEAKLFSQVDSSWKEIMSHTQDRSNALRAATVPGLLEMLQTNNAHLEKILKCLEDFLEIKRKVFPRFYFLSNDDLLAILAESKNPNVVQPHLVKCFENIRHLDIKYPIKSPPVVVMIQSAEGEKIPMANTVRVRGPVEQWMGNVESSMFDMVKKLVKIGVMEWGQSEFKKWMISHPGQVVLVVSQIMFNRECMRSFCAHDPGRELRMVHYSLVQQLEELADIAQDIPLLHQKTTLEALLTLYVHCRDVLSELIKKKVFNPEDFEWIRQLRYQWNENNNSCYVVQGNATFFYGYEYLGCSSRLVITPLTDRCWLTLTGALSLHLGGSPAGPAGTGKTETIKDLAKAVGKQCVVFNCSEGLDYKMMGKFFSGMAQSGAWCCFDEFNRIDMEVLSVIASQIHTIKAAKDSQLMRFIFEGREIRLNMSCGVFITMNPGYKGRVELPDNLKSLFRPVAMMVPDYQLISEIMLFSEGFKSAKPLSGKLVNLYQLASKQLSQQNHYDFGMRAIKTVLVMAGQKKQDLESEEKNARLSHEDESLIIISALKEANLPKFLAEDAPLFENILADLFPGIIIEKANTRRLEKAISTATHELGLQPWETQVEKVIQFYNQIVARHGVMLVGPSGGGKTTVRRILEKALVYLPSLPTESTSPPQPLKKGRVETFIINPKCVTLGELYGEINPNTMEWSDGFLASAARTFAQQLAKEYDKKGSAPWDGPVPASFSSLGDEECLENDTSKPTYASTNEDYLDSTDHHSKGHTNLEWKWIILDGPVDTEWVENLNTVLDDTRTLCLANSERIQLQQGMRMIFEVDSLSQASPATVSRCAMVYMDPADLGWKPFIKTWITRLSVRVPSSGVQYLDTLFTMSVEEGLTFIRKHKTVQPFPVPELGIIMNLCKILEAFIDFISRNGGFGQARNEIPMEQSMSQFSPGADSGTRRLYTPSVNGSLSTREEQKWFLEKHPEKLISLLGKLYIFAFTWAFGGILKREDEEELDVLIGLKARDESLLNLTYDFSSFVYDLFEGEQSHGVQMPLGENSVFSYFVDLQTGNFVPWENLVPSTDSLIQKGSLLHSEFNVTSMIKDNCSTVRESTLQEFIPTVDSVRYSFLSSLLLMNKQPVLITGESGVGKSSLIQNMLQKIQKPGGLSVKAGTVLGDIFLFNESRKISLLQTITSLTADSLSDDRSVLPTEDLDGWMSASEQESRRSSQLIVSTVQLGAHTSAARIQGQILNKLMKKGRDTLGAPKHKKVAVFIDDLNMPIPEKYGSQPPLELIRQFLELGGFYDTKTLTWKNVQDISLIAACAPPGGGRHEISPRLLKHFCMLVLPHPSVQALQHIFQVQLGSFLKSNNFLADIQKCRDFLSSSSIAIYFKMCHNMLATPAKCHYTFNLRDLFKVLQGLLQANESVIVTKDAAALLLVNEITRVFHDRLVEGKDRDMFYQFLSDELHNYFKISWPKKKLMEESVQFVDFLDMNTSAKHRIYRPVTNHKQLISRLDEYRMRMKMSSASAGGDSYVFFKEAIQHITRAARVFRQPGGHMMLVGLDGTGKVTSAAMASYISECDLYRLSITQTYSHADFREDLKKVFRQTGVLGKSTVFLITGADIINDSFLEDINCILNSGDVPDLFDKEELDGLFVELKTAELEDTPSPSHQSMLSLFLQRVRCKLHVVLALSPAGQTFRQHCRSHPALVNCCTVDWYDEWPEEALLNVAMSQIMQEDLVHHNEELSENVARLCVEVHKSVSKTDVQYLKETRRSYYVTPQNYLGFIHTFSNLFVAKKQKVLSDRNRFSTGLSKLLEATSSIEIMQQELVALGPQIEQKTKEIEDLMIKSKKDSIVVEQVRGIVKQEEEIMAQETKIVQEYAECAIQELRDVLPALQQAVSALDSLDKSDISEVRVYTHPPFLVLTVMNAVCVLLQKKPDWTTAKLLLGEPGFLKRLVNLDKDSIPEKVFQNLKKYSKIPDFNPKKVGIVSTACRSLCQWVLALEHYHEVQKMVAPKQQRVAEAQEALRLAKERLRHKQRSLSVVEEHLQLLQKQYSDSVSEKEHLAHRKQLTTERLKRASVLITALDEEKVRWKESVDRLDLRLKGIIGDILVSAAFIVYCGVFTSEYRETLVEQWLEFCKRFEIPVSADYSIIRAMASENEVLQWQNEGLPPDAFSTENAILVKNGRRWPLFIDPHGQAYKWICQMEGDKMRQVHATDHGYMKAMENAIRLGEAVLLQDVGEDLDPILKPILGKEIFRRAGQDFIKIGESQIEYNQNFRLYMTTQAPNPHFLPAVCVMVTMINFTVTLKGLQDQLLSSVVTQEQPHLELQRCHLLESITADVCTLRELEEKSLTLLQKTEGHLLDDEDLINTLQKSKLTSKDVSKRIKASSETETTIEEARGIYLPIAKRGAILYFVVTDLIHLNYMYQFSLQWFHRVFVESMNVVKPSETQIPLVSSSGIIRPLSRESRLNQDKKEEIDSELDHSHINSIIDSLTINVYKVVSASLFTEHQLCFSFMLSVNIMRHRSSTEPSLNSLGLLPNTEWDFFLHSALLADTDTKRYSHITDTDGVMKHVANSYDNKQNEDITKSADTENAHPRPGIVFRWEELSSFQRLILIKILHPESLISAIRDFIVETMGPTFLQTGGMSLKQALEESSATTPLIFILSSGTDPVGQLERLALETRGSTLHLDMISLGRGQGSKAEDLISKAQRMKGRWVFLQNCHLAASFMPKLHKIIDTFAHERSNMDPQFRLWLSSRPHPSFPIPVLQKGLKMAVEPPRGLKGKLLQTFDGSATGVITKKIFENDQSGPSWKKLLFSLCFFNAIVNERRTYGALGWNVPYEFTSSDLEVSVELLHMLLEGHREVPWQAVRYLTGEVVYGGRVTDSWDRRCLMCILDTFYNPSVLQETYSFSSDNVYRSLPDGATLEECRVYLNSLPDSDSPEIFGMHPNAERAHLQSQALVFLDTIVRMQPRINVGHLTQRGEKNPDEVVLEMSATILTVLPCTVEGQTTKETAASISDMNTTLGDLLSDPKWEALVKARKDYDRLIHSALLTVLRQEISRFNHLLLVIRGSLHALQQAIKGEIILNTQLEEVYDSLANLKVPALWQQHSYESSVLLGSWVDDLVKRITFFATWANLVINCIQERFSQFLGIQKKVKGSRPSSFQSSGISIQEQPSSFWLSAFFFPQGFLTAVLQNYARRTGLSVDSLAFKYQIQSSLNHTFAASRKQNIIETAFSGSCPQEGISVFGLFLDGAQWNTQTQALEEPGHQHRFYLLPQIHFIPQTIESELNIPDNENGMCTYQCPLYRTPQRAGILSSTGLSTNFVTAITLPTYMEPAHWIRRGVALLCQINE